MSRWTGDSRPTARRIVVLAYVVLMLGAALVCAAKWHIDTWALNFLPTGDQSEAEALNVLSRSSVGRTMVFSIGSVAEPVERPGLEQAAMELADSLSTLPEVAWVSKGPITPDQKQLFDVLFPKRWFFVDDNPDQLSTAVGRSRGSAETSSAFACWLRRQGNRRRRPVALVHRTARRLARAQGAARCGPTATAGCPAVGRRSP